ncbi:MAG: aspartate kinase, partial [Flavobacteriaceae bacterium]
MKVLKFGGTSVANAKNIQSVKHIVSHTAGDGIFVVVSAFGGVTDILLKIAGMAAEQDLAYKDGLQELEDRQLTTVKELIPLQGQSGVLSRTKSDLNTLAALLEGAFLTGEATPKLLDKIVGYGESLSSYIISEYFVSEGLDAEHVDSRKIIVTDENYGKATVDFKRTEANCKKWSIKGNPNIKVLGGFIAASPSGNATTLGRGGSDYTAAILAGALNAELLEIWTDVSGMFTANPKIVRQARAIPHISYEEAMELSHFGAKVLYPPTIQPILSKGIPIHIKNTFAPWDGGTRIAAQGVVNGKTVRGISHIGNMALLSLEGPGMVGIPGISKRFFGGLSNEGISVVLITQASSEHSICVGIA